MADSAISDLVNNGTLSPTDLVELARSPFSSGDSVSTELSYLRMYVLRPDADWRDAVDVATTANITLSGEQTIDGVLTSTSRILVKNQTTASSNGVYDTAAGSWTRVADFNTDAEIEPNAVFYVYSGTANGQKAFYVSSPEPHVPDTDDIEFKEFAANGLLGSETFSGVNETAGVYIGGIAATSGVRVEVMDTNLVGGPHVVRLEVSTDGGSTWKTASTDYSYQTFITYNGLTSSFQDLTITGLYLTTASNTTDFGMGTDSSLRSTAKIGNPNDTFFMVRVTSAFKSDGGNAVTADVTAWYTGAGTVDTIRLAKAGGTSINGRWAVFEEFMV